jgi:hypothetical protein
MEKAKLVRFIQKYHLNGNVQSVSMNSDGETLKAEFVTADRGLLGTIKMKNWGFEKSQIGILDTEKFLKLLAVLDNDVKLSLLKSSDTAITLKISDNSSTVNLMLSDLSVIPTVPPLKYIPPFNLKLNLDSSFINKFVKGKGALSEVDNFTVVTDNDSVNLVIGYASINTDRVIVPVDTEVFESIDKVSFNANIFRDILINNRECKSGLMEISSEGLAKMTFNVDDYEVVYFMAAAENVG